MSNLEQQNLEAFDQSQRDLEQLNEDTGEIDLSTAMDAAANATPEAQEITGRALVAGILLALKRLAEESVKTFNNAEGDATITEMGGEALEQWISSVLDDTLPEGTSEIIKEKILSVLKEMIIRGGNQFFEWVNNATDDQLKKFINDLIGLPNPTKDEIIKFASEELPEIVNDTLETIGNSVRDGLDAAGEAANQAGKAISDGWDAFGDAAKRQYNNAKNRLRNIF